MSNQVFPSLPGLSIEVGRSPIWGGFVQESASGRTIGITNQTYPRWRYKLSYEFLRSGAKQELEAVVALFNQMRGRVDTFLFLDDANEIADQQFAVGDGSKVDFQLVRSYGGYFEPIRTPVINPKVYKDGVLQYQVARTNLLPYSENLGASAWGKSNCSVVSDAAVAPSGETTADAIVPNSTLTSHYIDRNTTGLSAAAVYTASAYVKKGAGRDAKLLVYGTGNANHGVTLNFDTGAVSVSSSSQYVSGGGVTTSYGATDMGNGWWRIWISGYPDTAATSRLFRILVTDASGATTFSGDGTTQAIYVWGVQHEAGNLTPYIKTAAAAVTVTDISVSDSGVVTFSTAPAAGALLTWSGKFYWRCRFDTDELNFDQFLYQLWKAKSIEFTTVKG